MTAKVFFAIVETFIIFAIGAWIFRRGILLESDRSRLTDLTLNVFCPLLTFSVIVGSFKNGGGLSELWIMPLAGFLMMFLGGLLGLFLKRLMFYPTKRRRGTFHHICAINNYMFLPLIIIQSLYGTESKQAALLLTMTVGSTVGFWTVGIITLQGSTTMEKVLKSIFSVNVIAVIVAVAWCLLPVPVPQLLLKITGSIGSMCVPFIMLLTGGALYSCAGSLLEHKRDLAIIAAVRLIIIPLVVVTLLEMLPLPREVFEVLFIVALMPAAVNSVLLAGAYGGSSEFAGQVVLATTLLSLITVPLMIRIFLAA